MEPIGFAGTGENLWNHHIVSVHAGHRVDMAGPVGYSAADEDQPFRHRCINQCGLLAGAGAALLARKMRRSRQDPLCDIASDSIQSSDQFGGSIGRSGRPGDLLKRGVSNSASSFTPETRVLIYCLSISTPWIPPEYHRDPERAKLCYQTDHWAFGTTLWQIFSHGLAPSLEDVS